MKILMVSPEVAPLVKLGGLGDVVGALPKALAARGHDVRIICPLYGSIKRDPSWRAVLTPLVVNLPSGGWYAQVWEGELPGAPGVVLYLVEYNLFYDRPEVYAGPWGDHQDNDRRFSFLCRAALDLGPALSWIPDIIHGHDWTTGFALVYLNHLDAVGPLAQTASVMTVHNLQHQGYCHPSVLDFAGLPRSVLRPDNAESMGAVNMLKAGLYNATKITTVSPTYAREVQTTEFGCGLENVLQFRSGDLIGILNGIDMDEWDPRADRHLPQPFGVDDLAGKAATKELLQREVGLTVDPAVPLFGVVSRLYDQKGLDLLAAIVDRLMSTMKLQIVILGTGDRALEDAFRAAVAAWPRQFAARLGFDNGLAHRIYGGCDFFLMPSRFEPCGLSQMYSMRYGTVPVARATGGLVDTIPPYREGEVGDGRGFLFQDATPGALYDTIGWANHVWYDRPDEYRQLQRNGMTADFGWDAAAGHYEDVYRWSLALKRSTPEAEVPKPKARSAKKGK